VEETVMLMQQMEQQASEMNEAMAAAMATAKEEGLASLERLDRRRISELQEKDRIIADFQLMLQSAKDDAGRRALEAANTISGLEQNLNALTEKHNSLDHAHESLTCARNAYNAVITDTYVPNILDEESLQGHVSAVQLMQEKYNTAVTMLKAEQAAVDHLHLWNKRMKTARVEDMLQIETSNYMTTLEAENIHLHKQANRFYDMILELGADPPLKTMESIPFCHRVESPMIQTRTARVRAHKSLLAGKPSSCYDTFADSRSGRSQRKAESRPQFNEDERKHNYYDDYYFPKKPKPQQPKKKSKRPQSARPKSSRKLPQRHFSSMTIVTSSSISY